MYCQLASEPPVMLPRPQFSTLLKQLKMPVAEYLPEASLGMQGTSAGGQRVRVGRGGAHQMPIRAVCSALVYQSDVTRTNPGDTLACAGQRGQESGQRRTVHDAGRPASGTHLDGAEEEALNDEARVALADDGCRSDKEASKRRRSMSTRARG